MKRIFYILTVLVLTNFAFAQTVTFKVNMSVQAKKGQFTVGTDQVTIAGNFNGWNTTADVLTKGANDTIYSITKTFGVNDTVKVGDSLFFKFVKAGSGWENDQPTTSKNRELGVLAGTVVASYWFNNDSVISAQTKTITLFFQANMEFEKVSSRFNPATDTLSARGDFNGWSGTTTMFPSTVDANIYEGTADYSVAVGQVINYKFAFVSNGGSTWENGDNRLYTITQADYDQGLATIGPRPFNDLTLNNITNNPVTIRFQVAVDSARSSFTGNPFDKIENVFIAGANAPLKWPGSGWPNSDSALVRMMHDDGTNGDSAAGDKVWTIELTFPQYSPLRIEYKYGANWGLPSNTGANDNESSVGGNHLIDLTSTMVRASVRNIWSQQGLTPLYNIVATGIKEDGNTVPNAYSLGQNYPNPFNPSTNIKFSIPQSGLVNLKIYNILGQEVATLINEFKNAGSYEFSFDAKNLNSGVYFYSITANNFTSTKKMMLVK